MTMAVVELQNAVFTAVDFETTGSVPGWPNEPWQIGLYRFSTAAGAAAGECLSSYLRVSRERPFNRFAPGRHASRRDELAAAPSLAEVWEGVLPWLRGSAIVAHNSGTERTILRKAAPLDRLGPWIDTLAIARRALPGRESYALEDIIPDLGLEETVRRVAPPETAPHDALYDAIACGELLRFFVAAGISCCEAAT